MTVYKSLRVSEDTAKLVKEEAAKRGMKIHLFIERLIKEVAVKGKTNAII
jgi:predicted DNA binding CopG/RHH family protein